MRLFHRFSLFLFTSLLQYVAFAQQADSVIWVTNGEVRTIAKGGNRVYLGGNFTRIGQFTGGGAMLATADGRLVQNNSLRLKGWVSAAVEDGNGGWYIAGPFTEINGVARKGLAHIYADHSLDLNWKVDVSLWEGGHITTMVRNGATLYLAGGILSVNGKPKDKIAAIDIQTQQLSDWAPTIDGMVKNMLVANNGIYLVWHYTAAQEQPKPNIGLFDLKTGQRINWTIDFSNVAIRDALLWGSIQDIDIADHTLYLLGGFTSFDAMNQILSIDLTTSKASLKTPQIGGRLYNIKVTNDRLYLGGWFSQVEGKERMNLAALDLATHQLLSWFPVNVPVISDANFDIRGNTVYVGNSFLELNGPNILFAIDATTGENKWTSHLDGGVFCLAVSDNSLFAGGHFSSGSGHLRKNLAAIDLATHTVTDWDPAVGNGSVSKLLLSNGLIYVAGSFSKINDQERNSLATVDVITGQLTDWNPNVKMNYISEPGSGPGIINDMIIENNTLYVGGFFSTVGQSDRKNLAAIYIQTGQVTTWNPETNSLGPTKIILLRDQVYIGGQFTQVNGQVRNGLASIFKTSGKVTNWNPNLESASPFHETYSGRVNAMTLINNMLYVAGSYNQVASQPRTALCSIDLSSGRLTSWKPDLFDDLRYLSVVNDVCYGVGNNFYSYSILSGKPTQWNIEPPARMWYDTNAIINTDECIYLGGRMGGRNDFTTSGLLVNVFTLQLFQSKPHRNLNRIEGIVYHDKNGDCKQNEGEEPLPNVVVVAEPGSYYSLSDSTGKYTLEVDTGSYVLKQRLDAENARLITQRCPAVSEPPTVTFKTYGNLSTGNDFGNQVILRPFLTTSVTSDRRRRCFTNQTSIVYCNSGSAAATDAKVYVQLPPEVVLVSASVPYTQDARKNYVFSVGTLTESQCGAIRITDSVVCDNPSIRGLTACTKVWITPANSYTLPPDSPWDNSDIALSGKCIENGRVRLVIKNTGRAAMADSAEFRVLLDAQLSLRKNYKLAAGDSLVLRVPASGKTIRLEADQRPGHPRKSQSNLTIEGCVATASDVVSKGFVDVLPQDDAEPEVAISCLPIIDSFDPNDKLVSPAGTTSEHYTPTDSELKYTVRFQNTGTDYAYTATIIDTLSDNLDIASLQLGAASHKYSFNVSGKGRPVLTWTFNNINLPDSTRDQKGSNGFVQFSIKPKAGLGEKARIENFADIIFDYNEPIRTNTTTNVMYDVPLVIENRNQLNERGIVFLAPTIRSFTPDSAKVGEQLTIRGTHYQTMLTDNAVAINGIAATIVSATETELVVIIPSGVTVGKIRVTTPGGTAISDAELNIKPSASGQPQWQQAIVVSPNPTEGIFTVDYSKAPVQVEQIAIHNHLGQTIHSQRVAPTDLREQIDLSGKGTGVYLIVFKTNKGIATCKIIIK
jgi:uncharacterized repeat protein (TIGR01451 family)